MAASMCCGCCRVILHCLQFVLLLCLLVAEVIIQQHQLLQKNNFGSGSTSNGATLPVTAGGPPAYQRLPGSAAEAGDKQKHKQQEQLHQREKFTAWWVCGLHLEPSQPASQPDLSAC